MDLSLLTTNSSGVVLTDKTRPGKNPWHARRSEEGTRDVRTNPDTEIAPKTGQAGLTRVAAHTRADHARIACENCDP